MPKVNVKHAASSSVIKLNCLLDPVFVSQPQERGLAVIWTEADETRNLCSVSPPKARIKKTRPCQCFLQN